MKLNYHYNVKNLYLFKIGNEFKDEKFSKYV